MLSRLVYRRYCSVNAVTDYGFLNLIGRSKTLQSLTKEKYSELTVAEPKKEELKCLLNQCVSSNVNVMKFDDIKNCAILFGKNSEDVQSVIKVFEMLYASYTGRKDFTYFFPFFYLISNLYEEKSFSSIIEMYKNHKLRPFFNFSPTMEMLMVSNQINNMHNEVTSLMEENMKQPIFAISATIAHLVMYSYYELNTKEGLEKAVHFANVTHEICLINNRFKTKRIMLYGAGLAIRQGVPEYAIEFLRLCNDKKGSRYLNMLILSHCRLGDYEKAYLRLKAIISEKEGFKSDRFIIIKSVLDEVDTAFRKIDKFEGLEEWEGLRTRLFEKNLITNISLHEAVNSYYSLLKTVEPKNENEQKNGINDLCQTDSDESNKETG